jgi:AraC family transcriptional activator of mtrCDE
MTPSPDWLSRLLQMMTVTGRLEVRCAYGSPWRISYEPSPPGGIPYHVVLSGHAVLEHPDGGEPRQLGPGDIVLLPHGSAHVLHDGSGQAPSPLRERSQSNLVLSENDGSGAHMDMLCGRFFVAPPHNRWILDYLPTALVVSAARAGGTEPDDTQAELMHLVQLLRAESFHERLGGLAMLDALSATLFALTLRLASDSAEAPRGLLALAGQPRLAPAVSALFTNPERAWTLPELAKLCNMSRATFMRQFQGSLGRTAFDLLADVRMSLAANALKKPYASTEAVAEAVGYQSVAAFRRAFTQRIGISPGSWRRSNGAPSAADTGVANQPPDGEAEAARA